ncbi:MAG: MFS transporter [Thermoprotei archaeon]
MKTDFSSVSWDCYERLGLCWFVMFRLKRLALTSVGHFVNDGTGVLVFLVVDVLADRVHLQPWFVAALFVVYYVASSLLSTAVGRAADRTGSAGPMIGVGLALMSLGLVGMYFILQLNIGLFGRLVAGVCLMLVMGFGSTFYHPLGAMILQSDFREHGSGRALGINGAMGSVGRAIYPTIFLALAVLLTFSLSISAFCGIGLLAGALIWFGLRDKPVGQKVVRQELKQTGNTISKALALLMAVSFIRSAAFQAVTSWIAFYLTFSKGLGVSTGLGFNLTGMYALAIIGQPLFGLLVDRFDKRYVLTLSSAGAGASLLAYIHTTGPVSLATLSLFGLFAFSGFPLLFSITSDHVRSESSGFGNALVWGIAGTGGSTAGQVLTWLFSGNSYAHLSVAFGAMAVLAFVAAILTTAIPRPPVSANRPHGSAQAS